MANSVTLDIVGLMGALEKYEEDYSAYQAALDRGEDVQPPAPVNQKDFEKVQLVVSQVGKGCPIPERPDTMGIDALGAVAELMDQAAAAASQWMRIKDALTLAMWLAGSDASRPKMITKPDNFHDVAAWIPRRVVLPDGAMALGYRHACGIDFVVPVVELKAMIVEKGDSRKALLTFADREVQRLNEPARRYDRIRKDQAKHFRARLVCEHGEDEADKLFRAPRADNSRAQALAGRALSELEKQARIDAECAAIDALIAGEPEPEQVIDAEPTPPAVEVAPPAPPAPVTPPAPRKRK